MARVAIVSALLVVPCFWQAHLECVDLGSHTYTAWISSLIAAGKAPGLYLAHSSTNVLFDWLLAASCAIFGYDGGGKVAAAVCVLLFFWGALALVGALTGNKDRYLAIPTAMLAYGWTFQTGLFNFYLSLALAFWGLAALLSPAKKIRMSLLVLVPLMWMAHPLGVIAFAGIGSFLLVTRTAGWRGIGAWLLAGIGVLGGLRWLLAARYRLNFWGEPWFFMNGIDQLILWGTGYRWVALIALALVVAAVIEVLLRGHSDPSQRGKLARVAALYVLAFAAVLILPDGARYSASEAAVTYLTPRATTLAAVMMVAVVALAPGRKWKLLAWALTALAFFAMLFNDQARLSRLEDETAALVQRLPKDSRIVAVAYWRQPWRVISPHFEERACIGHCFIVSNYEIASRQFRVRARATNEMAEADFEKADAMQRGEYVVQAADLPLYVLVRCGAAMEDECLGRPYPGDQTGKPTLILGPAAAKTPSSPTP